MSDTCRGQVTIKPGLSEDVLQKYDLDFHHFGPNGGNDLVISTVDNSTVALVDGQITVVGDSFTLVKWRWEVDYSCEDLDNTLNDLIRTVLKAQPQSSFEGSFLVRTEEDDGLNIYRVRVSGLDVLIERPKLVWPNGDEEKL